MDETNTAKMLPFVPIIILNWNGWKDTIACAQSLLNITYPSYGIIIVDNGSTDNSVEQLRQFGYSLARERKSDTIPQLRIQPLFEEYSSGNTPASGESERGKTSSMDTSLILLKNQKNEGYAEGNNIGIRYALKRFDPGYILILNNDTVVHPEFLSALTDIAEQCHSVGFFGPKTYYYDLQGEINILNSVGEGFVMEMVRPVHTGDKQPDPTGLLYRKERIVDFITGSCVLVRRSVLDKVGLLDPDYFLYWEDADWCFRGRKKGYRSMYVPESIIWHKIGSSNIGYTNYYYYIRNRFVLSQKNGEKWQKIFFLIYYFSIELVISSYAQLLYYHSAKRLIALWRGVRDGIKYMLLPELPLFHP